MASTELQLERIHDRVELAEERILGKVDAQINSYIKTLHVLVKVVQWLTTAIIVLAGAKGVDLLLQLMPHHG